jgi:hypothetical protein
MTSPRISHQRFYSILLNVASVARIACVARIGMMVSRNDHQGAPCASGTIPTALTASASASRVHSDF